MTLVPHPDEPARAHVGELRLRRFRIGELAGAEQDEVARHTAECPACRARLKSLEEEQRAFERDIPFERFAGGVERARRVPRPAPRRAWMMGAAGLAAAAALVLVAGALPRDEAPRGRNRLKGDEAALRVAAADGTQRFAAATEPLRPGDRVRLAYRAEGPAHLFAASIDDAGEVTVLYDGVRVEPSAELRYLPDGIEFTGRGHERVFLLLFDQPVDAGQLERLLRAAHARAGGDLRALERLAFDGKARVQQFTWLLRKP